MKEISLNNGFFAKVDDNLFDDLNKFVWRSLNDTYARMFVMSDGVRKTVLMHRYILNVTDPSIKIDHIDGDGFNNCIHNLRVCSHQQNMQNHNRLFKNNTSGYRGVSFHKKTNKWRATIKGFKHIGLFDTAEEAALAFDNKAKELFGEFCGKLNFE